MGDSRTRDIEKAFECRRLYAAVPGRIGFARRFFLALEQETRAHPSGEILPELLNLSQDLDIRLKRRWEGRREVVRLSEAAVRLASTIFQRISALCGGTLDDEKDAYLRFAAGQLVHPCPYFAVAAGPDSAKVFLFAEFGFAARDMAAHETERNYWMDRIPSFVLMQHLYFLRYRGATCPAEGRGVLPYDSLTPTTDHLRPEVAIDDQTIAREQSIHGQAVRMDPEGLSRRFLKEAITSFS